MVFLKRSILTHCKGFRDIKECPDDEAVSTRGPGSSVFIDKFPVWSSGAHWTRHVPHHKAFHPHHGGHHWNLLLRLVQHAAPIPELQAVRVSSLIGFSSTRTAVARVRP